MNREISKLVGRIANLEGRLSKISVTPNRAAMGKSARKRRRKKKQRAGTGQMTVPAAGQSSKSNVSFSRPLECVIARNEILLDVKLEANKSEVKGVIYFSLVTDSKLTTLVSWLSSFAGLWERVAWLEVEIYWEPACGTTTPGMVTLGVDYDCSTPDIVSIDRAYISQYSPNVSFPVWQFDERGNTIQLRGRALQGRKWYVCNDKSTANLEMIEKAPFALVYFVTGKADTAAQTLGLLRYRYKVRFEGTVKRA